MAGRRLRGERSNISKGGLSKNSKLERKCRTTSLHTKVFSRSGKEEDDQQRAVSKANTINYYGGRLLMNFGEEEHREDMMKMKLGTC